MRTFFILASIFLATQALAGEPMKVDGVPVDGRTDLVSVSDIRGAIEAFKGSDSREPAKLTVISKDEMHAYIPQQDMGWITVKRADFVDPDHVRHSGWVAYGQGLPGFYEALRCIKTARDVYIFPVKTPLNPHRDDTHMRLLGTEARTKLVDLLGPASDWFVGFNNLIYTKKEPTNVGFMFQNGSDTLILFFEHKDVVVGTFNGEHLSGTLNSDVVGQKVDDRVLHEFEKWKAQYAQPELATPAKTSAQPPPL